jgi:hypothetical protein
MAIRDFGIGAMLVIALAAGSLGCDGATADGTGGAKESAPAKAAEAQAPKAEANYISGRVTMADGKPLAGDIKDITVSIYGVSEAAERVQYSPAVKPDGTYRQKVSGGQYAFHTSHITVLGNNNEFRYPLEAVGNLWSKNRDAADGIVQDFVWKVTGPTPYGQSNGLDPNNATHWYGMCIGLRADGYRNDIKKAVMAIPDGTKLTFTLKPMSKAIDGRELETITVERTVSASDRKNPDINDLPPASYELSGTATLPDGTVKPLLLQGKGDYPKYKPSVSIPLEKDNLIGGMMKWPCTFVVE